MLDREGDIFCRKMGVMMLKNQQLSMPQPCKEIEKNNQLEKGAFAALELNNQCMTAILCSILTIEKELFTITDVLTGRISD